MEIYASSCPYLKQLRYHVSSKAVKLILLYRCLQCLPERKNVFTQLIKLTDIHRRSLLCQNNFYIFAFILWANFNINKRRLASKSNQLNLSIISLISKRILPRLTSVTMTSACKIRSIRSSVRNAIYVFYANLFYAKGS